MSAFEAYRKIYSDVITPLRVAELLILRDDMPRSLHRCMNAHLRDAAGCCATSTGCELERQAGELHAQLHYGRTERHHSSFGLHEYLIDFLERIGALDVERTRSAAYSSSRRCD